MARTDHDVIASMVREGASVLDVGCGDGALTERIVAAGATVVGIDAGPDQIVAARARGLDAVAADHGGRHGHVPERQVAEAGDVGGGRRVALGHHHGFERGGGLGVGGECREQRRGKDGWLGWRHELSFKVMAQEGSLCGWLPCARITSIRFKGTVSVAAGRGRPQHP